MIEYAALFQPDEEAGGFVISYPDIGFGVSQAETEEEACDMAEDLLSVLLTLLIKEGKEIPSAKKHRGRNHRIIRLPTLASLKTELYRAFFASGIRKAELARRLGIPKGNVDRLFDFGHSTRIDHIEAAFAAIGKRLTIEVYEAA